MRGTIRIGEQSFASIGAALAAARPGEAVDLGPGEFGPPNEHFPLELPAAVTLRTAPVIDGRGSVRAVVDGSTRPAGTPLVVLGGRGSAAENIEIVGGPAVAIVLGAQAVRLTDCVVRGDIEVRQSPEAVVSFNRIHQGGVAVIETGHVTMTGNRIQPRPDCVAIEVAGGEDHRIDGNDVDGGRGAIHLRATQSARVTGNRYRTGGFGILLDAADRTEVSGNHGRQTEQAITVSGGRSTRITGNVAEGCDIGVLLEQGATDTVVGSNRWSECRVDLRQDGDKATVVGHNAFVRRAQ
jgi:nitrous oxidase accessory protein NosD